MPRMSPRLADYIAVLAPVTVIELLSTLKSGRVAMLLTILFDMSLMFSLGSPAMITSTRREPSMRLLISSLSGLVMPDTLASEDRIWLSLRKALARFCWSVLLALNQTYDPGPALSANLAWTYLL